MVRGINNVVVWKKVTVSGYLAESIAGVRLEPVHVEIQLEP